MGLNIDINIYRGATMFSKHRKVWVSVAIILVILGSIGGGYTVTKASLNLNSEDGIISAANQLEVMKGIYFSPEVLDQSQNGTKNWYRDRDNDSWQSFTPGFSGQLTRIDVYYGRNATGATYILSIYEGEGVGGTLLHTESVSGGAQFVWTAYTLGAPVSVNAGNKYTWRLEGTPGYPYTGTTLVGTVCIPPADPYADGRADLRDGHTDVNDDYCFKTYVAPVGETDLGDEDGRLEPDERWEWIWEITVTNVSLATINDVVVKDNLSGDLELLAISLDGTNFSDVIKPPGKKVETAVLGVDVWWTGNSAKVHWSYDGVGDLNPGDDFSICLKVATDQNPGGQQEYTSLGVHYQNSGANAKGLYQGLYEVEGVSDPVCVEVLEVD
jgi:hypothetical protein